jgi:hypothetical protein
MFSNKASSCTQTLIFSLTANPYFAKYLNTQSFTSFYFYPFELNQSLQINGMSGAESFFPLVFLFAETALLTKPNHP